MIAQIGGRQMLDSVYGTLSECRLAVGELHPYIKRSDDLLAHLVLARHIDAALQAAMVDGETGYLFHIFFCIVCLFGSKLCGDSVQQGTCYTERALCHGVPEVDVLVIVSLCSWRITDNAEA